MIITLQGTSASRGIAIGRIHILERSGVEITEKTLPKSKLPDEIKRFKKSIKQAKQNLENIKKQLKSKEHQDVVPFIDTHMLMLSDPSICSEPERIIKDQGINAEWALHQQCKHLVSVFEDMEDPYLRSRSDDITQVVNRVLDLLAQNQQKSQLTPNKDFILFADDLAPADTILMQKRGIKALLTEFGGPTSHTAILARSLRIPSVVGLHSARQLLRANEFVIVDGREGIVILNPDKQTIDHYKQIENRIVQRTELKKKQAKKPCATHDGLEVIVRANIELASDLDGLLDTGAKGVGLYRTEFMFMNRDQSPDEEEQYETYLQVVKSMRGEPVTIRTLDLGMDKQIEGVKPSVMGTANPALGLRAVRLCLKEPTLFEPQVKAILRLSADFPVRMMIPMLSNTYELAQVLSIIEKCKQECTEAGHSYNPKLPIGAMIEVPAAAICADLFARELDFLSIGTNDLIQYTIAIDRVDDEVSYLYDPIHPAVLRLIKTTIEAGKRASIPVAMCGEMAGDETFTRLLLGLGLREFSVHPNAILDIKEVINHSDYQQVKRLSKRFMRTLKPQRRLDLLAELNKDFVH